MYGYADSRKSLTFEEKVALMDDRSQSDIESECGRADIEAQFLLSSPPSQIMAIARSWLINGALRPATVISLLRRTAIYLLPSFVQHRLTRDHQQLHRLDKLSPTAYLDGMRGIAALFVFFCHYIYTKFAIAEGWGHNDANYEIWKLPFVKLLWHGPSMVCMFFVISGYALSLKPLKQIRCRNFDGLSQTLTSFVFRRAFRLYLPSVVSTFGIAILLWLRVYEWNDEFANDRSYFRNLVEFHPRREQNWDLQVRHWGHEMYNFVHIWGWEPYGGSTGYDVHLWTIPVEFRCSMLLFLTLLGTARLRTGLWFFVVACFAWFVLRSNKWEMFLFLAGMVIAQMDILRGAHERTTMHDSRRTSSSSISSTATLRADEIPALLLPLDEKAWPVPVARRDHSALFWTALTIPALYLMSEPEIGPDGMPGWQYLGSLTPEWFHDRYRYWGMIGAVMFVFCVTRSPAWQRLFNTRAVQYFGRLSYAIYLMHGPVCHTVGLSVERWAWGVTGTDTDFAYKAGFALAALVNVPLVVWAADVFWRVCDAPCVRFAKWIEEKVNIRPE